MKLASTLESVTVYRQGAVCVRRAPVPGAPAGPRLTVVGLPLVAVPGSLRARVLDDAALHVLDVRAGFDVELGDEIDLAAEARALDLAQQEAGRIALAIDRLAREHAELAGLLPEFREPPRREGPRTAPIDAMLALVEFVEGRIDAVQARRRALVLELEDAKERERTAAARLREAGSAARTSRAKVTRAAIVTLDAVPAQGCALAIEYEVPGACWAPTYALALDEGGGGRLAMRASIAQRTGEDWSDVRLALSTASLRRRTAVPELRSLRVGRAQPEPQRAGWRETPPGLDGLFADFDAAMLRHPSRPAGAAPPKSARREAPPTRSPASSTGVAGFAAPEAFGGAVPSAPPPPPSMAPMPIQMQAPPQPGARPMAPAAAAPMRASAKASSTMVGRADDRDDEQPLELDEGADGEASMPMPPPGPSSALLDYEGLQMHGPQGPARGRLAPVAIALAVDVRIDAVFAAIARAEQVAAAVLHQPPPRDCILAAAHERFDYRYEALAPADVPSTGAWTNVAVMDCDVELAPRYLCVPAVDPAVYRTVELTNRSSHALLPGPVDVARGGQFLLTTTLGPTGPGARGRRLGLGVEEAIKVARNTRFAETSGGLFGGTSVLQHEIEIDVDNRTAVAVELEVRERVPVGGADEKDLKIEEAEAEPPWTAVDVPEDGVLVHGLRRWRVGVAARAKARLLAKYTIRIPADRTLVGGNRRS